MHDLQGGQDLIVHMLEKQRLAVEAVHAHAVRHFHQIELLFLGEDVIDVRFQAGVGFEDFVADGALGGGFDFGFCAGGEPVVAMCLD